MSSGITNLRSLFMNDINGQKLAEFLIIDDQVISIPTFALMHISESDLSKPISFAMPGRRWSMDHFMRYLVDVCAQYKNEPIAPNIYTGPGVSPYEAVPLDSHVDANQLASLLDIPVKRVTEVLASHLTFPDYVKYL